MEPRRGVDIEKNKSEFPFYLAERFFSPFEIEYLYSLTEILRAESFYNIWTHKEAFIKATGLGLSQDLKTFTVGLNPSRLIEANTYDCNNWVLEKFHWKEGFSGAYATKGSIVRVEHFQYRFSVGKIIKNKYNSI